MLASTEGVVETAPASTQSAADTRLTELETLKREAPLVQQPKDWSAPYEFILQTTARLAASGVVLAVESTPYELCSPDERMALPAPFVPSQCASSAARHGLTTTI